MKSLRLGSRLACLAALVLLAAPAAGRDRWSSPFPGIRKLHRTTTEPWSIHALLVDLKAPGIRLTATNPAERRQTVSSFARSNHVAAAVNGDFFNLETFVTGGLSIGDGRRWRDTEDQRHTGQLVSDGKTAKLVAPRVLLKPEPWMKEVVSGHPLLVDGGKDFGSSDGVLQDRHPRTAVGLSQDGRTLILAVVDGRQSSSVGMTGAELSRLMIGLGAWTALNLDGGGSSAMYVDGAGVVNRPSDGRERVVANHLGVRASRVRGTLYGRVLDPAGRPVARASVTIGDQTSATGPGGRFRVYPKAGKRELVVSKPGYVTIRKKVSIEERKVVGVKLRLSPSPARTAAGP